MWNYGKTQPGASLIPVTRESLILTLFPRVTGRFTKYGLKVNRMRYKNEHFADRFLRGGTVTVAYNPEDVSMVWLIEDGRYLPFDLIEGRYAGKSLEEVQGMQEAKKQLVRAAAEETIQAKIDLADHIGAIASAAARGGKTKIRDIRENRRKEQNRTHRDYWKGGKQDA